MVRIAAALRALLLGFVHLAASAGVCACAGHARGAVSASEPAAAPADDPPPSRRASAATPSPSRPSARSTTAAHRTGRPDYGKALSELRIARWNIERKGGDARMKWDEHGAIQAIDRAIDAVKQASKDEGKSLPEYAPGPGHEARMARLNKAVEALRAARESIRPDDDNAAARKLKARAVREIEEAIRFAEQGIHLAEHAI